MLWIVLFLLALAVTLMLYQTSLSPEKRALTRQHRARREARRRPTPPPAPEDDVEALIARDPVEALARYGTPDDAERLMAQGLDLEALGYRSPDAE